MAFILRRRGSGRESCQAISSFSETGISVARNDRRIRASGPCFRWGCTTPLPDGTQVVNQASAISRSSNKAGFRRTIMNEGLCPKTFFHDSPSTNEMRFPVIVRPEHHEGGSEFHVCRNADEFSRITRRLGRWYATHLVNKTREFRVFVANGRAVCVAEKRPDNPTDIAWNVSLGGHMSNTPWGSWPLKAVKRCIQAAGMIGLDFSAVDVMLDAAGRPYVLESNSSPRLTSEYRQRCFAKVFDYIVRNGCENIPLSDDPGGWRKFAHPAIASESQGPG